MATNLVTEEVADALLRSISHNLRTPLTSIQGTLSYLQQDASRQAAYQSDTARPADGTRQNDAAPQEPSNVHDELRRDLIDNAVAEAERLNRLIGNLLDLARLEAGAVLLTPTPCDVQDLIGSALDCLGLPVLDHRVHVRVAEDLPPVSMDFKLLVKALAHVLDNAIRFSPAGTPIDVRARAHGENLEITVADRGMGMSSKDLTRVFNKFYRVGRTEEATGTGVGLTICKGILAAHGGTIRASKRKGGGTRITMLLSLRQREGEPKSASPRKLDSPSEPSDVQ